MKQIHPMPGSFETLPARARALIQEAIDAVSSLRMPQVVAYEHLRSKLQAEGLLSADVNMPSLSAFNRLILRGKRLCDPETTFAGHADSVLSKLARRAVEADKDDDIAALVEDALDVLDFRNDEELAIQLLLSILFHDNLAEVLNDRLSKATIDDAVCAILGLPQ